MRRLFLFLFFFLILLINFKNVKAIKYLTNCSNLDTYGETYYLTGDIYGSGYCFNITTSNVILDCQNHNIIGVNGLRAINFGSKTLISIKNCNIKLWSYGIYSSFSNNVFIENLTIVNSSTQGIYFYLTDDSTVKNVRGFNNSELILLSGDDVTNLRNKIEGVYSKDISAIIISGGGNNITIKNVYGNCVRSGIYISTSFRDIKNVLIDNVYLNESHLGIYVWAYSPSRVINLTIKNAYIDRIRYRGYTGDVIGIYFYNSVGVLLKNVTVKESQYYGFYASSLWNSTFEDTNIEANRYGNFLQGITNLVINKSKIIYNVDYGLKIGTSIYNIFIYDNLFNQSNNLIITPYNQTYYFNTTKKFQPNIVGGRWMGGNYWGNPSRTGYSDTCNDTNKDEFCDSPYMISSSNPIAIDYLPYSSKAIAKPPAPPLPPVPKPTETCAVCDPSQLNPNEFVQYFWIGACLFLNVILCNPILLVLFFMFLILLYFFKKARSLY